MSTIKACHICKSKSEEQSLLQNEWFEYFCKDCFKRAYSSASQLHYNKDADRTCNKMFPNSNLIKLGSKQKFTSQPTTIPLLPKRPLQCPHNGCNKFVSALDLTTHFFCEHNEIPIFCSNNNDLRQFSFDPNNTSLDVIYCIAVLNITDPHSTEDITVMVLCLENELVSVESEENENEDNKSIYFWALSNIRTNYCYAITISSINVKLKYHGPLLTISDRNLVNENCLSLNYYHIQGMSQNKTKSLDLYVTIYKN